MQNDTKTYKAKSTAVFLAMLSVGASAIVLNNRSHDDLVFATMLALIISATLASWSRPHGLDKIARLFFSFLTFAPLQEFKNTRKILNTFNDTNGHSGGSNRDSTGRKLRKPLARKLKALYVGGLESVWDSPLYKKAVAFVKGETVLELPEKPDLGTSFETARTSAPEQPKAETPVQTEEFQQPEIDEKERRRALMIASGISAEITAFILNNNMQASAAAQLMAKQPEQPDVQTTFNSVIQDAQPAIEVPDSLREDFHKLSRDDEDDRHDPTQKVRVRIAA